MTLTPIYTTQFEKDLKRMLKRGKRAEKIKPLIMQLCRNEPLDRRFRDHKLSGNYVGRRECHIEPDWLLVYKLTATDIIFERTGSHADLFE